MVRGFGQRVLSPQQAREVKILRRSVLQHFQHFPDPRVERTQHHSLAAIVTIAILAVLAGADGFVAVLAQQRVDSKSNQNRIETRQVWTVPVSQLPSLPRQAKWTGLTTVVMVRSIRQLWNKTTTDVRFYISSLPSNAVRHAQVIRSHWSVENSLYWVIDVTFNEDASRIRQGDAAQNLGLIRRFSKLTLSQFTEARTVEAQSEDEALYRRHGR